MKKIIFLIIIIAPAVIAQTLYRLSNLLILDSEFRKAHIGGKHHLLKFKCKPGEIFKYGCSSCICDETTQREVVCERRRCIRLPICEPLSTFKTNCFQCTCQLNKIPFCKPIPCQRRTNKEDRKF